MFFSTCVLLRLVRSAGNACGHCCSSSMRGGPDTSLRALWVSDCIASSLAQTIATVFEQPSDCRGGVFGWSCPHKMIRAVLLVRNEQNHESTCEPFAALHKRVVILRKAKSRFDRVAWKSTESKILPRPPRYLQSAASRSNVLSSLEFCGIGMFRATICSSSIVPPQSNC